MTNLRVKPNINNHLKAMPYRNKTTEVNLPASPTVVYCIATEGPYIFPIGKYVNSVEPQKY